jgi:hypothetical protein
VYSGKASATSTNLAPIGSRKREPAEKVAVQSPTGSVEVPKTLLS